jgi:hypothetical protein
LSCLNRNQFCAELLKKGILWQYAGLWRCHVSTRFDFGNHLVL